jgi:uncharacterized protein YjbI with pentapeptide repeats
VKQRTAEHSAWYVAWILVALNVSPLFGQINTARRSIDESCPYSIGTRLNQQEIEALLRRHDSGTHITFCNLSLSGLDLTNANLRLIDLRRTYLEDLRFENSNLAGADFSESFISRVNFRGANLTGATFDRAIVVSSDFSNADCDAASMKGARLELSQFVSTNLRNTDFTDATAAGITVTGAVWMPKSIPAAVSALRGVESTTVADLTDLTGLVMLRQLLSDSGLPEERNATAAIERNRTRLLLASNDNGRRLWSDFADGGFRLVMFEWPVAYGLRPGRALRILLIAVLVFGVLYAVGLRLARAKVYRVLPSGRLEPRRTGVVDAVDGVDVERLRPATWFTSLLLGLHFSLLSAAQIGFREFNVGRWLTRLQTREYTLQPLGWVRVVSGAQSLLSVYLVALWVLSYFGRPWG